jgi:hypothetical protein
MICLNMSQILQVYIFVNKKNAPAMSSDMAGALNEAWEYGTAEPLECGRSGPLW